MSFEAAASLAAWLIKEKGKKRNVALLIASRKHDVPFSKRSELSKRVTEIKNQTDQMRLL